MNKKGMATLDMFEYMVGGIILIILIGVLAYAFNITTEAIDLNVMAGQVNLSNVTKATLGQINDAGLDKLNLLGLFILFGMFIAMLVNAYFTRNDYPKIFIIFDVILIWFAYILAAQLSNTYETVIGIDQLNSIFVVNLSQASTFLLRLPIITTITGILIMIITYSNLPRSLREEAFVGSS